MSLEAAGDVNGSEEIGCDDDDGQFMKKERECEESKARNVRGRLAM